MPGIISSIHSGNEDPSQSSQTRKKKVKKLHKKRNKAVIM